MVDWVAALFSGVLIFGILLVLLYGFMALLPLVFQLLGAALARLSPLERVSEEIADKVRSHFKLGETRTHQQDVGYGLYQLVDIAVRSLSPAFNAVTTASTCLDHIGSILRHLAPMDLPPWRQYGCAR